MTGTREWEYIKYPKPIVSLKKFSRFKTFISSIIKPYFKIFPSTILKIPSYISIHFSHLIIQYHMLNIIITQLKFTFTVHYYGSRIMHNYSDIHNAAGEE